ncbi:MAG: hypothetical protein U0103_25525 [Candidatus Obscuribacterales bacterium]
MTKNLAGINGDAKSTMGSGRYRRTYYGGIHLCLCLAISSSARCYDDSRCSGIGFKHLAPGGILRPYSGELKISPSMFELVRDAIMQIPDTPSRFLHDAKPEK